MKKTSLIIGILIILVLSFSVSQAAEYRWKGFEYQALGYASVSLNTTWAIGAQYILFKNFENNLEQSFFYLGPDITTYYKDDNHLFWFSPKVGAATKWFDDRDCFIAALLAGGTFGKWNVFAEADLYRLHDLKDYYGIYLVDYSYKITKGKLLLGAGAEQIGKNIWLGPRGGLVRDLAGVQVGFEVRTFFYFQKDSPGYNLRLVNTIFF